MKNLKTLTCVLFSSMIFGCTATGTTFQSVTDIAKDNGILYVYRDYGYGFSMATAHFKINGVDVFGLDRNGYSFVYLPEGTYKLSQKWWWAALQSPLDTTVTIRRGEPSYVKFTTALHYKGMNTETLKWSMQQVSQMQGLREISDKKLQPSKKINEQVTVEPILQH